jgi:hypothetical protein
LWHQTHDDGDDDVDLNSWCCGACMYTWSWFVMILFYEMCFGDKLQSLCLGMAYDWWVHKKLMMGGVNQSKFCWKCGVQILLEICVQTHKTWSSHKNSWKCMHLLSLISIDSSFDRILNTKFWTTVLWWGDKSRPTYWNICFQYYCYILKYLFLIWLFSPWFMKLFSPLHYCCNSNILNINDKHVFLPTQWHC